MLSRVLRIMFAIGRCKGAVQGAPDHVCQWGCCPGVQGAPDHVCHWGVLSRGAVQGAPDHVCDWAVSGCC